MYTSEGFRVVCDLFFFFYLFFVRMVAVCLLLCVLVGLVSLHVVCRCFVLLRVCVFGALRRSMYMFLSLRSSSVIVV